MNRRCVSPRDKLDELAIQSSVGPVVAYPAGCLDQRATDADARLLTWVVAKHEDAYQSDGYRDDPDYVGSVTATTRRLFVASSPISHRKYHRFSRSNVRACNGCGMSAWRKTWTTELMTRIDQDEERRDGEG
jgi:hypothetical protein